ncbi:MAG: preprotein translocase subunit YajC [Eubacteriales bacterium]|nr:preprotein translocase subunit YajC [Eubacteriales bacterium]HBR31538.1 preprotein translocase subunit YajC [Clostridiales bacterium]
MTIGSFLLLGVVFYFFAIRPQKKQEKEIREMRASIEVGDAITTAGGIVGVVVKVKDDMILIETGADRTKLQIQKWAVHSILAKAGEESPEEK